ncbi:MAG: atypical/RIO/RIO1 protein kinase [Amphiamblys sp. WSBS2006]|nr:MAG: atypical/RIO/RIO1 protein kinase [Amphiamblys sp. WSBS2006]
MLDYDEDSFPVKQKEREKDVSLEKFMGRINLNEDRCSLAENTVAKKEEGRNRFTDKKNRATCEQVLDPRTRVILLKLLKQGELLEINGCVSTGKEANVYHGVPSPDESIALKIFKTSILRFKDRKEYVEGEFRFRRGYSGNNPRKMVRQWAEKEYKNLQLLRKAELPSPRPLFIKQHVLGMSFIGDESDGTPAPRLKDWRGTGDETEALYRQALKHTRALYKKCRLVHGDLSEYNLLVYKNTLYVIDVSQSVENDNPRSLDFLRRDCFNVLAFFKTRGIETISVRQFFDYVTDCAEFGDEDAVLDSLHREKVDESPEGSVAECVFLSAHIPRTLFELKEDAAKQEVFHGAVTGLESLEEREKKPRIEKTGEDEPGPALSKKERKKKVKEENRERRKTKKERKKKKLSHKPKRK